MELTLLSFCINSVFQESLQNLAEMGDMIIQRT